MSEVQTDIEKVERDIAKAQNAIERRGMAQRLYDVKEFKKLIVDEYLLTDAARLVQLSGDPACTKEVREDALLMAQATGYLKRYLSYIILEGNTAENGLEGNLNLLDQLRAEAMEE